MRILQIGSPSKSFGEHGRQVIDHREAAGFALFGDADRGHGLRDEGTLETRQVLRWSRNQGTLARLSASRHINFSIKTIV